MTTQTITSAGTSVNQLPAVLRLINTVMEDPASYWTFINDVLDYGGGRFDKFTNLLASMRIRNWVFDPFNRSEDHNKLVRQLLTARPADIAVCSNVLNVVKEPAARRAILKDIKTMSSPTGNVFFTVYVGDQSSRGRKTTKGFQANRPTRSYVREIRREFKDVWLLNGKLIVAKGFKDSK
jgi:hypothetical protein